VGVPHIALHLNSTPSLRHKRRKPRPMCRSPCLGKIEKLEPQIESKKHHLSNRFSICEICGSRIFLE
ncbi:hypothetical protein, partial [Solimonas marina]|uniref:hypothetical protein n=1 Tax=Solimonas marina TaxID=2714601 RepID=UPI0019D11B0E